MKVKTQKTVTEEKEITLPYFFKQTYSFIPPAYHAIFSDNKSISIFNSSVHCASESSDVAKFISDENSVECSEQEFTEAFEARMEYLLSFMPQTV